MKLNEKEEIERAIFVEKLLLDTLEAKLEKEYIESKVIEIFERAEIITVKRDYEKNVNFDDAI